MKRDEGENKNLKNTNVVKTDFFNKKRCVLVLFVLFVVIAVFVAVKMKVIQSSESQSNKSAYGAEEALILEYEELQENEQYADDNNHIKFAPFFMKDIRDDDYSERIKGTCNEVGKSAPMLIEIGVESGGTLENGVITIDSRNFRYQMSSTANSILKKNYISKDVKKIELNNMTSGSQTILMGDIFASITNKGDYSRENSITLTGTWVADDGEKIDIKKTIDLKVDWYGTAAASISASTDSKILSDMEESDSKKIEFDFTMNETKRKLLPKQNVIDIEIPEMFGYEPEVECKNPGVTTEYEDGKLHIIRENNSYSNTYTIVLKYPQEAYDQLYGGYMLTIPIEGYFECYNNKQYKNDIENDTEEDSEGIFKTNIAKSTKIVTFREAAVPSADYDFSIDIPSKVYTAIPKKTYSISKQSLINAYDGNKESEKMMYTVKWGVVKTSKPTKGTCGLIMEEPDSSDNINRHGDNWDANNMSDYVKNTQIFFIQKDFITQNGYVKVFDDDTNTLIKEFTPDEIKNYNSAENSFTYDAPIKHIRIETNEAEHTSGSYLNVYNIKEVDIEAIKNKFSKDQIAEIETLRTDLRGSSTDGASIELYSECKFAVEKSYASIKVAKSQLSAVATEPEEQTISIQVPRKDVSYANWKDGQFLVAFATSNSNESPIAYIDIDDVEIKENELVGISGYEVVNENGNYCIKIVTNNESPTPLGFTIEIKCKMLVNPMISSSNINVNLYSYNPYWDIYHYEGKDIYDADDDEDTEDMVGVSSTSISVLSANSFLTVETISDYNDDGEVVIGPNIAEVVKKGNEDGDKKATAKINVSVMNRYNNGTVSNVKIVGRVPYIDNKYIDREDALGSEFTATIDKGIEIPEELKDCTKVYYTTNESAINETSIKNTKNLSGDWIEDKNVTDFNDVKGYLIIIDKDQLSTKKEYKFSYTVSIPDNTPLNSVSYSCHKVYYDFVTQDNKIELNLQPNKVGLRLVKYYDLELMKTKINTEHPVQGAKYKLTEIDEKDVNNAISGTLEETGEEISRIITSNSEGNLISKDLRVNQIYCFKEIQAPSAYELNNEIIVFKVVENGNGGEEGLKCVFLPESGEQEGGAVANKFNEDVKIEKSTDGKYTLSSKVEDKPKFVLNITKQEKEGSKGLAGVIFDVDGQKVVTDNEGKAKIENLSIGAEHTLQEIYTKGYYPLKDVTFEVTEKAEGGYSVTCKNNDNQENCVFPSEIESDENNDLIQVNVTIKNEKVPTYKLKIKKVDESNNEKTLKDATFLLRRKDLENSESFTTGDDGTVEISDMYAFVEGKDGITGEYTLKETASPTGYVNNREEISFYVQKKEEESEEKYEVKFGSKDGEEIDYQTVNNVEIEGDTVIITIQDKPMFKLTKIDEETETPLANTEFIIYELNDDGTINRGVDGTESGFAKDVNGNIIGTKQENGNYVVTTDDEGSITLALGPGNYKAVETGVPEGYEDTSHSEVFIVKGNEGEEESIIGEIPSIDFTEPTYEDIEEVIEIEKIEDLVDFSLGVNKGDEKYKNKKIKLMCDLDFKDTNCYKNADVNYKIKEKENEANYDGEDLNGDNKIESIYKELTNTEGRGFTPIGNIDGVNNNSFSGIFDGQSHKIKNIYINSKGNDNAALFGFISDSVIKNITVTGTITAEIGDAAGICGNARGSAFFENCNNECTINGGNETGGIIGYAESCSILNIVSCTNKANITANNETGGIIGLANNFGSSISNQVLNIKHVSNTGNIQGVYTGGIVGEVQYYSLVKMEDVSNSGTVNIKSNGSGYIGGIAGLIGSISVVEISDAVNYESATITSKFQTGGIVGHLNVNNLIVIKNSKNEASVNGHEYTGGIVGGCYANSYNTNCSAYIIECSNTGNITCDGDYLGGIFGDVITGNTFIKSSYNTGDIIDTGTYLYKCEGGIIGGDFTKGMSVMEDCYNTGKVKSSARSGGLSGYRAYGSGSSTKVSNCYNSGYIEGGMEVGGLIAGNYGGSIVKNSHNLGDIKIVKGESSNNRCAGGLIGNSNSGNYEGCSNSGSITVEEAEYAYAGGLIGYSSNGGPFTNCSNTGNIKAGNLSNTSHIGGIAGFCSGNYTNCYNSGNLDVECPDKSSATIFIGGIVAYNYNSTNIQCSHNTGNINCSGQIPGVCAGGIEGSNKGIIQQSYNEGDINCDIDDEDFNSNSIYIGGIAGMEDGAIQNCYNIGEIVNNEERVRGCTYVGGIAGQASSIVYTYNAGDVYNNIESQEENVGIGVGPICGKFDGGGTCNYYPNDLTVVGQNIGTNAGDERFRTPYSEEDMKTEEFVETLKTTSGLWMYVEDEYPILDIAVLNDTCEATEIEVTNKKKKYDITAQIGKNVSGNRDGGEISIESENTSDKYMKISDEDVTYVETVEYGKSNTVPIKMQPKEGYKIQKITLNGKDMEFDIDESGNCEIQADHFTNITTDLHIEVYFAESSKLLTINKTDEKGNKLSGAKFKIESDKFTRDDMLEKIDTNESYTFSENESGELIPNNIGIKDSTAHSCYMIDLEGETGDCAVEIEAALMGPGNLCAAITESEEDPTTYNKEESDCVFMNEANFGPNGTFISDCLTAGKIYYLHLGYTCDTSIPNPGSVSGITVKISDINVLTESEEVEGKLEDGENVGSSEENYHFEKTDEGYVPNNLQKPSSSARSYIPINLSGKTGKYSVKIEVTSKNKGTLYAFITENKEQSISTPPFYTSSGEGKETCFSPMLEGGKQYYVCFTFSSAETVDESKVVINEIALAHEETYVVEETNENGQIVMEVPEGDYTITEIKAPDGYALDKNSQTCKIGEENKNTADFTNAKLKEVIIHYYEKGTGEKFGNEPHVLKEDVHIYGENGSEYNTTDYIEYELEGGYTLEVNKENEYVISENATGYFGDDVINVYYYYEKTDNKLTDISARKQWQMPEEEANNYRATLKLVSIVNGNSVPAVDNNGDEITKVIQGNGSAVFRDVKQYEDGLKVEYKVQEVKIEKLESINTENQEEVWVEVPLNQFKVMYGIEE